MRCMFITALLAATSSGCFYCESRNEHKAMILEIENLKTDNQRFKQKSLQHLARIEELKKQGYDHCDLRELREKVMEHSAARTKAEKQAEEYAARMLEQMAEPVNKSEQVEQ